MTTPSTIDNLSGVAPDLQMQAALTAEKKYRKNSAVSAFSAVKIKRPP
jgi:hypothetical protein